MNYEEKIKKLELILKKFENNELAISESVELYAEAMKLYKDCVEYLDKAKGDVYKIKQDLQNYREEKMD